MRMVETVMEDSYGPFIEDADHLEGEYITCSLVSSMETMDDNPGTGRVLDKFVLQPMGRKIENILGRLALRYFLPPETISSRIFTLWSDTEPGSILLVSWRSPLNLMNAMSDIASMESGVYVLSGLQRLMDQAT